MGNYLVHPDLHVCTFFGTEGTVAWLRQCVYHTFRDYARGFGLDLYVTRVHCKYRQSTLDDGYP